MGRTSLSYDLFVIGGGPAGYTAALLAARKGLAVALAEADALGGTCTNRGCIPTKSYIEALRIARTIERAARHGIIPHLDVPVSMDAIRSRTVRIVERLSKGIDFLLKKAGVAVYRGRARLMGKRSVSVDGLCIDTGAILIATGSRPKAPPLGHVQGIMTSDDIFDLTEAPSTAVIMGAGAVGMEMAHILACLGARVTVVEARERILPTEDAEVSRFVKSHYRSIRFITDARVTGARNEEGRIRLEVSTPRGTDVLDAHACISCIGRDPVLPDGAVEAGIETDTSGGILVDGSMRTSVPTVFAAGDVTGRHMYAYVASREAEAAVSAITGEETGGLDYRAIPKVVFLDPEIASVGEWDADAPATTGVFPVSALGRARTMEESEGFARVVCSRDSRILKHVTIVAPHASELISWAALGVHARLTLEEFLGPVCPHPTMAELLKEACEDALGRCIHKP